MQDPVNTLYELVQRAIEDPIPLYYTLADGTTVAIPPLPASEFDRTCVEAFAYANTSRNERKDLYDPLYGVYDSHALDFPLPQNRKIQVGHKVFVCAIGPGSRVTWRGIPSNPAMHGNPGPSGDRFLPADRIGAASAMVARSYRDATIGVVTETRDRKATASERRGKATGAIGQFIEVAPGTATYCAGYVPRKGKRK